MEYKHGNDVDLFLQPLKDVVHNSSTSLISFEKELSFISHVSSRACYQIPTLLKVTSE